MPTNRLKLSPPFQRLFSELTLYRYRKFLDIFPIILFILVAYNFYANGQLTIKGGLALLLMVLSYFYKRATLFLVFPTYLIWESFYRLLDFKLDRSFYLISLIAFSVILILNFIRLQYFEDEEVQVQFVSKKLISNLEHLHIIESQLAFYLGIFSFIFSIGYFIFVKNIFFTGFVVGDTLYAFLRYIFIYSTVISFSFGLAGWVGGYSRKMFFVIGCMASFFVMFSDILIYVLKV